MPKYVLHYFDIRGRAEISRMIMNAAGIPYTERRIQFQDWPSIKPATLLGQLPYLEVDNQILPQSISIARYLAKEAKLYGKDNLEQAKTDAVVDTCNDGINAYITKVFILQDAVKKEEAAKVFLSEDIPKLVSNIVKLVGLYGKNGYAVGDNLTWADLLVYEIVSLMEGFYKISITEKNAVLEKNKKIVEAYPKLGAYLKSRK